MREQVRFWPEKEQLREVLKTEAEAASTAVALAVHQPVHFLQRTLDKGDSEKLVSESELLKWFLDEAADANGFRILPLVGETGVGKSHVVRWLDARLSALPDAERRVVIRVPKGQSLKGVLDQILSRKELSDPSYDAYREKIRGARDSINPREAAGLLCERLAQALEQLAERSQDERLSAGVSHQADPEFSKLTRAFGRPGMLPTLLRNQQLRDLHFVKTEEDPGVIRRLVAQLYEDQTGKIADDREHIFEEADLVLPEAIYDNRVEYGKAVLNAAEHCTRDVDRRRSAVAALNAALDPAKRELVGIGETVHNLFLDVRAALHRDNRELVLLVEDFAVLSGLQGQLLQVIQQGTQRAGSDDLCTIRSVLAYTPGYLLTRTILSRAVYEFIIPDLDTSEDETHKRVTRLVAAYLNAARVGRAALEERLRGSSFDQTGGEDWVPVAEMSDAEHDALLPFGIEDGIPLFPFNRAAIRALNDEAARKGGHLRYNPRIVIQLVLSRILMEREAYEAGVFPPISLSGPRRPRGAVEEILSDISRRSPRNEQERYRLLATYWADESDDLSLKTVRGGIAQAFALKPLTSDPIDVEELEKAERERSQGLRDEPERPGDPIKRPSSRPPKVEKPNASVPASIQKWRNVFNNWLDPTQDVPLKQSDANALRKHLVAALDGAIDWDWVCFKPDLESAGDALFVSGSPTHVDLQKAVVVVAADADRKDKERGRCLQAEFIAVSAHHEKDDQIGVPHWSHEGAEDDLARYCAFIDRHASTWRDYRLSHPLGPEWSPIDVCVSGLAVAGRALHGEKLSRTDLAEALNTLFISQEVGEAIDSEGSQWSDVQHQLRCLMASNKEGSFRSLLLRLVGARQGGASSVLGLDVAQIVPALKGALASFELSFEVPPGVSKKTAFVGFLGEIKSLRKIEGAIQQQLAERGHWLETVESELGVSWDKDQICEEMREQLNRIPAESLATSNKKRIRDAIDRFKKSAVREAVVATQRLTQKGADRAQVLAALASDVTEAQNVTTSLLTVTREEVEQAQKRVDDQIQGLGMQLLEAEESLSQACARLRAVLEVDTQESVEGGGS